MNLDSLRPARLMREFLRVVVYLIAFAALPLGIGYLGLRSTLAAYLAPTPVQPLGRDLPPPPVLDLDKPTVAVVLGDTVSEVADMLGPYVAFKTAEAFNVITVADRKVAVSLSGGLDVAPHFSFAELDARLGRDPDQIVSTAGILSGIDGSLHMIDRLRGRALALQVARALHYDGGRFLDDPTMPQLQLGPRDAIIVLNAAFGWDRAALGVPLYDGMEELPLAAIYDTYAPSFALFSVASAGGMITTRHGLHLVARRTSQEWSASGGMLLPSRADDQRFPFDAALEDVARRQNIPTAEFAAKRLEYRTVPALKGRGWSRVATLYRPVLLGLLALAMVFVLERLILRRPPVPPA